MLTNKGGMPAFLFYLLTKNMSCNEVFLNRAPRGKRAGGVLQVCFRLYAEHGKITKLVSMMVQMRMKAALDIAKNQIQGQIRAGQ